MRHDQMLNTNFQQLERKIVYVGRIPRGFSRKELMDLFQQFGGIAECSVHFRDSGQVVLLLLGIVSSLRTTHCVNVNLDMVLMLNFIAALYPHFHLFN